MRASSRKSPSSEPPLQLLLIGSFDSSGDPVYRLHQPAAALARLDGVEVHELHPLARDRDAAALAADVLVLVMGMDVELLRLVHQRRQLGRPTVLEVNDWLPGVQACNPAHANWSDQRARRLLAALIRECDAVQVSSAGLAHRLRPLARHIRLVANQLADVPPLQPRPPAPLRVGWGGSAGHFDDVASIAPALSRWLERHRDVQLDVMADPAFETLFAAAPEDRFVFHPVGPVERYLQWLESLHIGLAPLLPTDYNVCHSDVKFLEYASRGVAPLLQRLPTYAGVRDGHTGLLFSDTSELLAHLDQLVSHPERCRHLAESAHTHVCRWRHLAQHAPGQLAFYRHLRQRSAASVLPGAGRMAGLERVMATELPSLRQRPGWQACGPRHWKRDLSGPAEQAVQAGQEAMQAQRWPEALEWFRQASTADPADPYALVFLGQVLERLQRPALARQAYERAAALDPLCSRPPRALAALHRRQAEHWSAAAGRLNPLAPASTALHPQAPDPFSAAAP